MRSEGLLRKSIAAPAAVNPGFEIQNPASRIRNAD